jgi:hypothetical protein
MQKLLGKRLSMTKPSTSPQRHTFQKSNYIKAKEKRNQDVSKDYLDMFDNILNEHKHRFSDPTSRENNLEYDLLTTDWILEKVRTSESYAQSLYAAFCNNSFQKLDVISILKEDTVGYSWRYAGGIVADMRQQGDYIDFYCSGMGNKYNLDDSTTMQTPEGCITEEIQQDLRTLEWVPAPGGDWEKFRIDSK